MLGLGPAHLPGVFGCIRVMRSEERTAKLFAHLLYRGRGHVLFNVYRNSGGRRAGRAWRWSGPEIVGVPMRHTSQTTVIQGNRAITPAVHLRACTQPCSQYTCCGPGLLFICALHKFSGDGVLTIACTITIYAFIFMQEIVLHVW